MAATNEIECDANPNRKDHGVLCDANQLASQAQKILEWGL